MLAHLFSLLKFLIFEYSTPITNYYSRIERIIDTIDKVVNLTTIETLRAINLRGKWPWPSRPISNAPTRLSPEPNNTDVDWIRRALLSYWEDHRVLFGIRVCRVPIKYFFESGFDDYMNMIMSNIIRRPSRYKKQEAISIIGGMFWELRNFNNRTFVTIPQATSTIMLDQYTTGSTDPQYYDLSPFKKWTFKDGNRHV